MAGGPADVHQVAKCKHMEAAGYDPGAVLPVIDQELTEELVIVSPDAGRVKTARNFARRVGTSPSEYRDRFQPSRAS